MDLRTAPYSQQLERWPKAGRHILAQFDTDSVVVYQAFRPSIAQFAVEHGHFGGEFSLTRMSWIKTNFLWMMYRCGWAAKQDQECVLAVTIAREVFDRLRAFATSRSRISSMGRTAAARGSDLSDHTRYCLQSLR